MVENSPMTDQELDESIDALFEQFTQKEHSPAESLLVQHLFAIHQCLMLLSGDQMRAALRRFVEIENHPESADPDERAHLAFAYVLVGSIRHLPKPKKKS